MMRNYDDHRSPRLASGFKLAVAAVMAALIIAAGRSPIDWRPMTATVHDLAASTATAAPAQHFPSVSALQTADATFAGEGF